PLENVHIEYSSATDGKVLMAASVTTLTDAPSSAAGVPVFVAVPTTESSFLGSWAASRRGEPSNASSNRTRTNRRMRLTPTSAKGLEAVVPDRPPDSWIGARPQP